jgi:hypothetical protein
MSKEYVLVPIRSAELSVHDPLPWSVYDSSDNLLLVKGFSVESASQLEMLVDYGFQRDYISTSTKKNAEITAKNKDTGREVTTFMDQIKWLVGESLDLQPQENPEIRYNVRLIGFVRNKSLLITAPMLDDKLAFLREGQTFLWCDHFSANGHTRSPLPLSNMSIHPIPTFI